MRVAATRAALYIHEDEAVPGENRGLMMLALIGVLSVEALQVVDICQMVV